MRWQRLGNIYSPNNLDSTHAAIPLVSNKGNNFIEVIFSSRNPQNKSVGYSLVFSFDGENFFAENPHRREVLNITKDNFDRDGVNPCKILDNFKEKFLFYTGWNTEVKNAPFETQMGIAIYDFKKDRFEKRKNPILKIDSVDPVSIGYLDIFKISDKYIMIYESNLGWLDNNPQNGYQFVFKIANSDDGINWSKLNKICFPLGKDEYVFSRPTIIEIQGKFHMWYCYKKNHRYLIGHAESFNGIDWIRCDNISGLQPGTDPWENEEVCYPYVFSFNGKIYMLYNGNGYGKTGFGICRLEDLT